MKKRKEKNKERKQIDYSNYYYIQTTGGNSIYKETDEVTVQVSPYQYIKKRVGDLNSGESVVFNVFHVKTSLEDVEDHLYKSPLYSRASDFVIKKNSRGVNIPKLRIALLNSLADQGVIRTENLESIIMKETFDLSKREYENLAEYVKEKLTNSDEQKRLNAYIPSLASIEFWLRGLVPATGEIRISPADHDIYKILKYEFGDEFNPFISEPDDINGFYKNYRIRNVLRQNIMKTLNSWRGIRGEEKEEYESESKINISREIKLIKSHFMGDIDNQLKTVLVTKISPISKKTSYELLRNDHLLGEGVIKGEINTIKDNMIDYSTITLHENILDHYFHLAISNSSLFKSSSIASIISFDILPYFMRMFGEEPDPYLKYLEENPLSESYINIISGESKKIEYKTIFLDSLSKLKESILNYDIDKNLGFEEGTLLKLVYSLFKVRKSIPHKIFNYRIDYDRTHRLFRKNLMRYDEILFKETGINDPEKLKKITEEFGDWSILEKKGANLKKIQQIIRENDIFEEKERERLRKYKNKLEERYGLEINKSGTFYPLVHFGYELMIPIESIEEKKEEIIQIFKEYRKDEFILTRELAKNVLSNYNLEKILELATNDFTFLYELERLYIPFPKPPQR